jgi:hypothetical protein
MIGSFYRPRQVSERDVSITMQDARQIIGKDFGIPLTCGLKCEALRDILLRLSSMSTGRPGKNRDDLQSFVVSYFNIPPPEPITACCLTSKKLYLPPRNLADGHDPKAE